MSEGPSAPRLSTEEADCLARLAGLMIPASEAYGMPAGDDAAILSDLERTIGRDEVALRQVLNVVMTATRAEPSARLADAYPELVSRLRAQMPDGFAVVETVIARAYYRDPRVLTALGLVPRPPFPEGFNIPPTDWSLLEPVRARGRTWRRPT